MSGYVRARLLKSMLLNDMTVSTGSVIEVTPERADYLIASEYAVEVDCAPAPVETAMIAHAKGRKRPQG